MRPFQSALVAALLLAPLLAGCPAKREDPQPSPAAGDKAGAKTEPAEKAAAGEKKDAGDEGAPVKLARVVTATIVEHLDAPATVVALPGHTAAVAPTVGARVLAIHVHPGQLVRRGQVIATLTRDPAVAADQAKSRVAYQQARLDRDRAWRLFRAGVTPQLQAQQADAALAIARADLSAKTAAWRIARGNETLRAPIAGVVTTLAATVGQAAEPATPLATLTDLRRVGLEAQLGASRLGAVHPGGRASVRTPWGQRLNARVVGLQRSFDPVTQRAKLLAAADNPEGRLAIGMFTTLELFEGSHAGLAVPAAAVIPRDAGPVVYVVIKNVAHERRVAVGHPQPGGLVELVSGVKAGEQVATEGAYLLTDGAKVKAGD